VTPSHVLTVDFTPFLAQLRADHALAASHLQHLNQVFCLGSRILISAVVRASLQPKRILGAATTAEEGLALVARHRPDLLVVSDGLEEGCGVDLALQVKRKHPCTRVLLLLTRESSHRLAPAAIAAGCDGVLREAGLGAGGELMAIRAICNGSLVIDSGLKGEGKGGGSPATALSHRERQVLQEVARGLNNREIAYRLKVSVDTIKTHLSRVMVKLSARDRTHAAVLALQLGLVNWP
jgi:DNA-binding NarL/FixJ family response regulator